MLLCDIVIHLYVYSVSTIDKYQLTIFKKLKVNILLKLIY